MDIVYNVDFIEYIWYASAILFIIYTQMNKAIQLWGCT